MTKMRLSHIILVAMILPVVGYILFRSARESFTGVPGLATMFSSNDFSGDPGEGGLHGHGRHGSWTFDARDRCHSCIKPFEESNILTPRDASPTA